MRAVVQRVSRAKVTVNGETTGEIGLGLLVLLGVGAGDTRAAADYLAEKTIGLRIFEDAGGKMNLSVAEVGGALLVVSQFTLYGDARRGKRPSFDACRSARRGARTLRIFCGENPRRLPAPGNRTVSGNYAGGTGESRAGHDSAGFGERVLKEVPQVLGLRGND